MDFEDFNFPQYGHVIQIVDYLERGIHYFHALLLLCAEDLYCRENSIYMIPHR